MDQIWTTIAYLCGRCKFTEVTYRKARMNRCARVYHLQLAHDLDIGCTAATRDQ